MCLITRQGFLEISNVFDENFVEKICVFDEQKVRPGKMLSVRWAERAPIM